MDHQFYSRATGKLRKAPHHAFGDTYTKGRSNASRTEATGEDFSFQYPMGYLTPSQKKYVESFLQGIGPFSNIELDISTRAIHWIGMWLSSDKTSVISCSISQPHVSNGMVHLNGINEGSVIRYCNEKFIHMSRSMPSIRTPYKNPQLCGKFSIPLADSMVEHGILKEYNVTLSLIVLSQMKPTFVVCSDGKSYKCRLTHDSCRVMMDYHPNTVGIVGPTSRGQSYSFKSVEIAGDGTASSITVHKSGALQYQGKPNLAFQVGKCFKECINYVISSRYSSKFVNSLALIVDEEHLQTSFI